MNILTQARNWMIRKRRSFGFDSLGGINEQSKLLVVERQFTEDDVKAACEYEAAAYGVPMIVPISCVIAESYPMFNPYSRRPEDPTLDESKWPDVSFGAFQQTIRWSQEYRDAGYVGQFPGEDFVISVGNKYYDPYFAASVAIVQLDRYWVDTGDEFNDTVNCLCRYNNPNTDPFLNPNREHIINSVTTAVILGY